MSNEIANQLLVRVQNEMARNIAVVKKQLIEWLERPESGGVDVFAEQLSEVGGGLSLLSRNNAAQLCTVLADSVKTLDAKFRDKAVDQREFGEIGAEIASGLLLLNDYIDRLDSIEPTDERLLSDAIQAIQSILQGNGLVKIAVQPKIDRETYQALSAKVTEVLETSRNQIEQYGVYADKQFDASALISHNKNLISLFEVLNLKAPQLLLKQINQMLEEQLSESQWIDIAEAMILVEETLKYANSENAAIADYSAAIDAQSGSSRGLEIQKMLRDIGDLARGFYENLRKVVSTAENIQVEQAWKEAALRTSHFAAITQLVGELNLASTLNQLALQFAQVSLQASHKADAYPAMIDVLVAAEYIFSDLNDTAKVNASDVNYLKQVSDTLGVLYPVSAQAKALLAEFASYEAPADAAVETQAAESLAGGLDDLLDGLDALEAHFDGVTDDEITEEPVEEAQDLPQAVAVVGEAGANNQGDLAAPGAYQAYFAGKSINDLANLHVPAEKESFLESHDSAVMDDEIREFFLEELTEKIQEIQEQLEPWQAKPHDQEYIGTVRRAFHTIKGSGRTVGYEALGECAWQHEQMLNRVIDKTFSVNPTMQNMIADTVELLRILTGGGGFIEQQAALLTQASLAEHLTKYLTEHADSDEQTVAQFANSVRQALTDDAKNAAQTIEKITEKVTVVHTQAAMPSVDAAAPVESQATYTAAAVPETSVVQDSMTPAVADALASSAVVAEKEKPRVADSEVSLSALSQSAAEQVESQDSGLDFFAGDEKSDQTAALSAAEHSVASVAPDVSPTGLSIDFEADSPDASVHSEVSAEAHASHAALSVDFETDALDVSSDHAVTAHAHVAYAAETHAQDAEFSLDFDVAESADKEGVEAALAAVPDHALSMDSLEVDFASMEDVETTKEQSSAKQAPSSATNYAFGQSFYAGKTLADLGHSADEVVAAAEGSVDEDVLSIFLEELDSNVQQIDRTLPKWKAYPANKEHLEEVRRAFHTIKGSGKMVGYSSLGDFAWQYENLLNAIAEAYIQTNALVLNSVGDASDLLKVLRTEDGFIEHKSSLGMQAKVAEQIREKLMANPQMGDAEQEQLAQNLYAQMSFGSAVDAGEEASVHAALSTQVADKPETPQATIAAEMVAAEAKPNVSAHSAADISALAAEVGNVIGTSLRNIDMSDEDDKSILRDMVANKIAQQDLSLSPEQLAALSAQLSAQLAGKLQPAQVADLLSAQSAEVPQTTSAVVTTTVVQTTEQALPANQAAAASITTVATQYVPISAYRHMADMLQRSLAAQPLDEDDEAILAQQLTKEIGNLEQYADSEAAKAQLQAQLSAAYTGSNKDSAAYEALLANVLDKAFGQSQASAIDDALMQRLIATVSRMTSGPVDSDDADILRHQIQAAVAEYAKTDEQKSAIQAEVEAKLKSNFAQQSEAAALLDEVFADEEEIANPLDALEDIYADTPTAVQASNAVVAQFDDSPLAAEQVRDTDETLTAATIETTFAASEALDSVATTNVLDFASDENVVAFAAVADEAMNSDGVAEEQVQFSTAATADSASVSIDMAAASAEFDAEFAAEQQDLEAAFAAEVEPMFAEPAAEVDSTAVDAEMSAEEKAMADAMLKDMAQHLAQNAEAEAVESVLESVDVADLSSAVDSEVLAEETVIAPVTDTASHFSTAHVADYVDSKSGDISFTQPEQQRPAALSPSLSSANAPRVSAAPSARLSEELSKISAHPSLENAVGAEKPKAESKGLEKFLTAVDTFESLSQQIEENSSPEVIDNLIESVYDIEDSLEAGSVPDWIWRMLDAIEQLLLAYRSEGANISLNAASILRQSIDLIEHFDDKDSSDDANQTINSLMKTRKELGGAASQRIAREPVAIATTAPEPQNWDEWIADPNAGTELAEIFLDEAVLLLGRSQLEAERWDNDRNSITHLDAIRRDMHTLKGGARMSGYLALGDLTHAVESMIESIVDGHSEANNQAVAILNGALWQAMIMLDSVRDGFLPQTDPYMLNNINRFLNLPLPYPEVAEQEARLKEAAVIEKAAPVAQPIPAAVQEVAAVEEAAAVVEEEEPLAGFDENIDPVLVDIFTDEAQELIDQAEALFAQDLKNTETIEELKRNMHTLKGAARLVGLTAIGDTSHLMESVIEQLPDYNDTKMRQAKTLLNLGHEALYSMLDSVLRKEMPIPAKSLNESLTIFAKEGRFVQPSADKIEDKVEDKVAAEAVAEAVAPVASEVAEVANQQAEAVTETVAEQATATAAEAAVEPLATETVEQANAQAQTLKEAVKETAKDAVAPKAEEKVESKPEPEAPKAEPAKEESKPEVPKAEPAKEESKPETPKADAADATPAEIQRYVRVDADLLDEMIAMVGEAAIMRSRLENVSSESAFNLNELTRIANRIDEQMRRLDNETEAQMLFRRESQATDDEHFDPLEMDRFSEIQQLSRQLTEAINDLKNVQEALSNENALIRNLSIQQGFIQRGIQDRLLTTQLVRFDVNEARLKRLVRQTAKSVDKDIDLIIEGGHVELERRLIEDVLPAMEHMIRNSVGHGIETPKERIAAGKSPQGKIKLTIAAKASNVEIRILDDGRGFDYDRIREKARSKGWLDESKANDQQYLSSLMMRSGFSTAQAVTQLSGRGVGMDVVNEMVKQRRGQLIAESIPGKGAQFTILMPFTMSISEVLLVDVAEQTYAVPMSAIAAIAQVPREDLQRSHNEEEVYAQYDGMDYRLYILGDYFKPQEYQFAVETATAPALFINASGEPTAFFVDRIANRLEVIVKNVNRQVLNIPGISGATILGDGNVVPVLEPLDLSRRISSLSQHQNVAAVEETYIPNVLVVDDSVTMRKVSTRLLERNGYIVESAKDGLDAIDVLQRFTPDLILLDIEMPRMDGFEFASHVRQNSHVPNVPIIMITSRTGDKHRERADQIGVQGYLGKPYREDILIETIESLLGEKANG